MNKLVIAFGLFGLTFFFGLGVTAVQLVTDSFFFPFDMGGGFDADDLMDVFDSSSQEEDLYDYGAIQESMESEYSEMTPDEGESYVDPAISESGSTTWTCGDGTVIEGAWTNDGECDCNDCSDEEVFQCSNGQMIPKEYIGDGDCDCADTCEDES
jgi:hypothetical protein